MALPLALSRFAQSMFKGQHQHDFKQRVSHGTQLQGFVEYSNRLRPPRRKWQSSSTIPATVRKRVTITRINRVVIARINRVMIARINQVMIARTN